jgi:hypothetical protein
MRVEEVCLVSKGTLKQKFQLLETFLLNKNQDRYF